MCTELPCSLIDPWLTSHGIELHGIVRDVQHRTLNTISCRLQSFVVILLTTTQFPTTKSHNALKYLIPKDPPTVLFKPALSHKNGNQQLHFNNSKSSPWHWTQAGLIPAEAEEGSWLSHIPALVTHLGRVTPQRGLSFSASTLHKNRSLAH